MDICTYVLYSQKYWRGIILAQWQIYSQSANVKSGNTAQAWVELHIFVLKEHAAYEVPLLSEEELHQANESAKHSTEQHELLKIEHVVSIFRV